MDEITTYEGLKDGDIVSYLKSSKAGGAVSPSFRGYEPFKGLLDLGLIVPEKTYLRLHFDFESDQHYDITKDFKAKGIDVVHHSGLEGLFKIEDLLKNKDYNNWEISLLDRILLDEIIKNKKKF